MNMLCRACVWKDCEKATGKWTTEGEIHSPSSDDTSSEEGVGIMLKLFRLLVISLAIASAVLAQNPFAENLVANGNFNQGSLAGWTEAGPDTIPTWHGAPPVPAQVFSDAAPMHVTEIRYYNQGGRHIVRTAIASTVGAYDKYSMGWTLSGATTMGYPWINQVIRVAPGTYTATVSWRVVAGHETAADRAAANNPSKPAEPAPAPAPAKADAKAKTTATPNAPKPEVAKPVEAPKPPAVPRTIGGVFIINTDKDINAYTDKGSVFTGVVWNDESKGKWLTKTADNIKFTTHTGYIEVRLQLLPATSKYIVFDRFKQNTDCDYVAFDDVVLQLTPVEPQQATAEPQQTPAEPAKQ
ncbi:MAG: hypothetical protein ACPL7O_06670 [Armatimonadota bacterium]